MGNVYEAIQESLNRRVAIKTLTAHPVHVPKLAVRFQQEAKAVARLHHTNIINIFDSGLTDGIPYFAMQLIDGCGLDQKIAEAKSMIEQESGKSKSTYDHILVGKLDRKKIANLAMQIADGLDYAHRKGVLHRDIKPANLLLDKNGSIWIGDFGLAKLADQDTTRTGDLLGTLKYLPPEAIKGEWDERSDVYSLGLTLYELVTLQPAYSETENVKLLARISSGSPPTNPIAIDSTIPHDLETIIMKSIACEPDSRYQTAGELRDDLDRFIKDQPVLARRAHLPERLFKWAKRNPSLAGLIATVTMVAIFGVPLLGYLWFSAAKQRDNALYEKSVAQSARASEKIAKELALDSQRREEVLREDAEAFAYSNAMQLAMINLEKGNLIEAEIVLNQWDPANNGSGTGKTEFVDRRDWEWYFIRKMLDSSIETFVFDHLNVANIAIRPDEKQIAAIVEIEPAKREIVLINLDDHSRTSIGTVDFAATGIGYSPDGSKLVASGYFETQPELWGKVVVWDIEKKSKINDRTFTETETQKYRNGFFGNRYLARCYFEDKKTIVVGPGPFRILDADSLEVKESHEGTAFFRFGKEDITFRVEKAFRTIDGQKEQLNSDRLRRMASFDVSVTDNLSKNPNRQTNLFFSHHNRQGQSFVRILRYHRKSRDEFGTLEDYQDVVCPGVCCGSIAKDGKKFVWATKTGSVYVTTINRESSTYRLNGHMQLVNNVILTENGKHVFTCSVDGTIKKWNVERPNQKLSSLPLRTKNFLADIQFTEDNESILGIAEAPTAMAKKLKPILTHNLTTFKLSGAQKRINKEIPISYKVHWPRNDVQFSNDGKFVLGPTLETTEQKSIVGLGDSGKVGIWNTSSTKLIGLAEIDGQVTSCEWNKQNEFCLAIKNKQGCFVQIGMILKPSGLELSSPHSIPLPNDLTPDSAIQAMAYTNDRIAIAITNAVLVYQIDKTDGKLNKIAEFFREDKVNHLCFSSTGTNLAISMNSRFSLVDLNQTKELYTVAAPRRCACAAFNPGETRIAIAGYDGMVYLLDTKTGNRVLALQASNISQGTRGTSPKVAFSHNGKKIATVDFQKTITVWTID